MEKICESCGMPMVKTEDFGGKNTSNKYCVYCTDQHGILKSFEEKIADMTEFIMRTSDVNEIKAREMARENLIKQPAWEEYSNK